MAAAFQLEEYGQEHETPVSNPARPKHDKWSKFKLGWFLVFSILALALTLAVSFSCVSVATSKLHISSVHPAALIQGLTNSSTRIGGASNNSSNATQDFSTADFGLADLPDQYLFGISGLCRHWYRTDETRCQYRFPQVPSVLAAVLEDSNSTSVRDNWTQLLTSTNMSSDNKTLLWKRCATAAAGLLITSILWAFFTIAFALYRPDHLKYSIYLDIVDAIMVLAAAIMWIIILNSQGTARDAAAPGITPTLRDQILNAGPGLAFLWALTVCKLMVTPLMTLLLFLLTMLPLICCCAALCGDDSDRVRVDVRHHHHNYYHHQD